MNTPHIALKRKNGTSFILGVDWDRENTLFTTTDWCSALLFNTTAEAIEWAKAHGVDAAKFKLVSVRKLQQAAEAQVRREYPQTRPTLDAEAQARVAARIAERRAARR